MAWGGGSVGHTGALAAGVALSAKSPAPGAFTTSVTVVVLLKAPLAPLMVRG
jgi:hypothetical protein